jgi:hypothetical protein
MSAIGKPISKKHRAQILAVETHRRRRTDGLRVLASIGNLIKCEHDVGGFAKGSLEVVGLATSAGVSRKSAARSLSHWRNLRVLWLSWRGHRTWEVRFEREVVERVLSLPVEHISVYLIEHKRRREARRFETTLEEAPHAQGD